MPAGGASGCQRCFYGAGSSRAELAGTPPRPMVQASDSDGASLCTHDRTVTAPRRPPLTARFGSGSGSSEVLPSFLLRCECCHGAPSPGGRVPRDGASRGL